MDDFLFETVSACALNRVLGYDPALANSLIQTFGNCRSVFAEGGLKAAEALGPYSKFRSLISDAELEKSERELEMLRRNFGAVFIPCTSRDYPQNLLDAPDHPVGLYFRSSSPPSEVFSSSRRYVSIVGTRDISLYGRQWCSNIVRALSFSKSRPTVVSGLALGVDAAAHRAALDCALPTIAVMPTGIDDIYPRSHRGLSQDIVANPLSALVTDYPPNTAPKAVNFLRRNRIIASLGASTILVESKIKGGGTMTCRLAWGYGREVYALPGRIDDLRSEGCLLLLKEKIAEPIVSMASLASSLGLESEGFGTSLEPVEIIDRRFPRSLPEEKIMMARIIETISLRRSISIDELCGCLSAGYGEVSSSVRLLEGASLITVDLCQRCALLSLH